MAVVLFLRQLCNSIDELITTYSQGRLGIKQSLSHSEALDAKDLVPTIGHLKWSWWQAFGCIDVGVVAHAVCQVKLAWALPYLNHALLERSKDAFFLVLSERIRRRIGEFDIFGIGWLTCVDG